MRFAAPELLYFLALLVIPLLIHLFQLQRFRKEAFTNVRLLQKIELESRRSSQLKKLLLLLMRLLTIASLVLAFAQPFFEENEEEKAGELVIYLDNSFSMERRSSSGRVLLEELKQELIEQINPELEGVHLMTNQDFFTDLSSSAFKKAVSSVQLAPGRKSLEQLEWEISNASWISDSTHTQLYLFSDQQEEELFSEGSLAWATINRHYVLPEDFSAVNVALDSLWLEREDSGAALLKFSLSSTGGEDQSLSVSMRINETLFGKVSIELPADSRRVSSFKLATDSYGCGALQIDDQRLSYDNQLYFCIQKPRKKRVMVVGTFYPFLRQIYKSEEFILEQVDQPADLGTELFEQDLLILSEVQSLSPAFRENLSRFLREAGNLVIIPPEDPQLGSYTQLAQQFFDVNFMQGEAQEMSVNSIAYGHPFFRGVFQEETRNFEYPKSYFNHRLERRDDQLLLAYSNGDPFVINQGLEGHQAFLFASPLSEEINELLFSPLIVPLFYNFAESRSARVGLYGTVGAQSSVLLESFPDGVIELQSLDGKDRFIPLQQRMGRKMELRFEQYPERDGLFELVDVLPEHRLAFNYARNEKLQAYSTVERRMGEAKGLEWTAGVRSALNEINRRGERETLWQLFIIFALVFTLAEAAIQKWMKA